ncbi:hypothetical protein [Cryobacterium sp. W22_MBD10_FK3]|uniref:hypothetical protein n=1 Tax=Cryobacterium sp. W22_MBD10_FK3 TaxID=3240273 RepID=UPI003F8E771D
MMLSKRLKTRVALAVVAAGAVLCALSGCAVSESRKAEVVASQEVQLQEFIDEAAGWGAEIMAQIPAEEAESVSGQLGGTRQASDDNEEWPKYYYWAQRVDLHLDGPRTPTEFADELEPWLKEQGWVRNRDKELSPRKDSFVRDYARGRNSLAVEVYTVSPPQAQSLNFTIVSPQTEQ